MGSLLPKVTRVKGTKRVKSKKAHLLPADGAVIHLISLINVIRKMIQNGKPIPVQTVKVNGTQHPFAYLQKLLDYWSMNQLVA